MQETCLQIADHWFTIGGSSIVVLLTIFMIILMIRDRKKKIAINELKEQTKKLKGLSVKLSEQTETLKALYNKATEPRIVKDSEEEPSYSGNNQIKRNFILRIVKNDIVALETNMKNEYFDIIFKNLTPRDYLAQNSTIQMNIKEKEGKINKETFSFVYEDTKGIKYNQDITIFPEIDIKFHPPKIIQ